MRVVVVSAWPPWLAGHGGVWVLHHHLRELAPRHDITLLAAGAPRERASVPAGAATLPKLPTSWFGTDRSAWLDYAARRAKSVTRGEPSHVWYVERPALLESLQRLTSTPADPAGPVDLVYGFGWGTAALHRHLGALPVVHTPVDAWTLGSTGRLLPGWRRITDLGEQRAISRHERRHYPRLSAVTVVAEQDADRLRQVAPEARVEVIPNGVDPGPEPDEPPAAPVLGFHGNFESRHNVEGAVYLVRSVWPAVRRRIPDATVLLAGRGPGPEVRELAGDGVRLVADAPDLRPLLDGMSVEVTVMDSGSGLKNKVLEAMAAGRPVVANGAGLGGIGAGPGLYAARDADHAADLVVELLEERSRLVAAGRAARERVCREFTWSNSARRLEAVWETAAGR